MCRFACLPRRSYDSDTLVFCMPGFCGYRCIYDSDMFPYNCALEAAALTKRLWRLRLMGHLPSVVLWDVFNLALVEMPAVSFLSFSSEQLQQL